MRRLLRYAVRHRPRVLLASAASVVNKLLDLAPPLLIGLAVDVVVNRENSPLGRMGIPDPVHQVGVVAILTVLIWVLESATEYAQKIYWRNLAQQLQHELRLDAYGHVQKLDLAYFEDQSTGGLLAVLNDDVNQLEQFLDNGANALLQVATTVIAICSYFLWLDPRVGLWAMAPMPFVLWGSFRYQRLLTPHYARVREQVGLLNGQLAGNLGGVATIKSFTAEDFEVDRIRGLSDAYRRANSSAIRFSSAFAPLIRMIILVGFTAMLVVGGLRVLDGEMGVGSYSVVVFGIQRLLWPLTSLGQTFDLYQRAMASTRRIFALLDIRRNIHSGSELVERETVRGGLTFEDVSFSYGTGPPVLTNLNLEIAAGQTTAIVGSTGSGKSTVAKLCLRFYDPTEGVARLDGTDLRDVELNSLRESIGLVSQDVFLFHGSVRENIAYGRRDASLEDIVAAAKTAEAHAFIETLSDGYDTIVGERGQKLSGGQRQRLAIARAVLKDPPILVLDEATSAVDNETEAAIQRSFERLAVGRTAMVIAHRLSTVRNAHRIYVLENGTAIEYGTHDELLARDGLYSALWRVQTGELAAQS